MATDIPLRGMVFLSARLRHIILSNNKLLGKNIGLVKSSGTTDEFEISSTCNIFVYPQIISFNRLPVTDIMIFV